MSWWDAFWESAATRLSSTLSWWQWAILAAIPPAIILLYFLKLKRRPIEVPSTYLWLKSIEDLHVNSIWQRLRNNLLLYLQLLLLLLAVLALLRPSFQGRKLLGNRSIFLVDTSASMQATDVGRSRLDEAKARVHDLIDDMQTGDVAMIISFADTAKVEQPFTDDRRRLRQVLDAIVPTERPTALAEALRVASGLANPGRSGEKENPADVPVSDAMPADLYVFSDGRFGAVGGFSLGNLNPVFVPIGQADAANVAVAAFATKRGDMPQGQLQAFGRIANYGPAEVTVLVELLLNGKSIDADRQTIPAGDGRGVTFDLEDLESGVLQLQITEKDSLAVDNQAWTIINPPRHANVLLVTPGNGPLERVVQTKLVAEIARAQIERPDFLKTPKYQQLSGGGYDLIIFDRCKPERMPQCNTFFIGELPPETGWKAKEAFNVPRIIDVDKGHPLMDWLDLGDVHILTGTPLVPPSGGKVLVDADGGPMLAIAPRETYEDAVLGFALVDTRPGKDGKPGTFENTNWHVAPAMSFPAFIVNLVDYLGGGLKAKAQEGGRPGKPVPLEAPRGKEVLEIRTPAGEKIAAPTGSTGVATFTATEQQGVYEVLSGGKPLSRFAVNLFDAEESRIAIEENPKLKIGYVDVEARRDWHTARKDLWKLLLLGGLAVLGLEWYIYNRRVYV